MSEPNFSDLVQRIKNTGNFDHPGLDKIDVIGRKSGFDQKASREAFFVARDLRTLEESEKLDGGSGDETKRTDPRQVLEATFSRGN